MKQMMIKKLATTPTFRTILAMCALSLSTSPVLAQKGLELGIVGSIHTSSLINSTDQAAGEELNYKNYVHTGAGFTAGYTFSKHFGVETGVMYSKQGQGYTGQVQNIPTTDNGIFCNTVQALAAYNEIPFTGTYSAGVDLTCMKIPLLLKFTGNNTKKAYLSTFTGAQLNLLTSASYQVNNKAASFAPLGVQTIDAYNKTTIDAVFGLGMGVHLSDHLLLNAHLRFDYGLGDVENKSKTVSVGPTTANYYGYSRASTHNATGGLMLGLSYKFGKIDPNANLRRIRQYR